MNVFDDLIHDLGTTLNIPLHAEKNRLCRLNINDSLHVQIEFDPNKERILLCAFLSELPPGKFRENTLKECLKANQPLVSQIVLAYSEKNNKLAAFIHYPIVNMNATILSEALMKFIEKADFWKVAIETGQLPSTSNVATKPPPGIKT